MLHLLVCICSISKLVCKAETLMIGKMHGNMIGIVGDARGKYLCCVDVAADLECIWCIALFVSVIPIVQETSFNIRMPHSIQGNRVTD